MEYIEIIAQALRITQEENGRLSDNIYFTGGDKSCEDVIGIRYIYDPTAIEIRLIGDVTYKQANTFTDMMSFLMMRENK